MNLEACPKILEIFTENLLQNSTTYKHMAALLLPIAPEIHKVLFFFSFLFFCSLACSLVLRVLFSPSSHPLFLVLCFLLELSDNLLQIFGTWNSFVGLEHYDNLRARYCHDFEWPQHMTQEVFDILTEAQYYGGSFMFNATYSLRYKDLEVECRI